MRILIRGAGDLATGIAYRLFLCGHKILMTDIAVPTAVRRTVAFSRCIYEGCATVEGVTAVLAKSVFEAEKIIADEKIAVMVDPEAAAVSEFMPEIVVDAIIAKKNLGTHMDMAPLVIGVGPGFTAGVDVHAVVETKRGHYLGKVYYEGSAIPNTGIPGEIGGYSVERIIRAKAAGEFHAIRHIGDTVDKGELVAESGGEPIYSLMPGIIRGMLQDGVQVAAGMKCGDIDARCERDHCFTISDKARAIGGGVLEAVQTYSSKTEEIREFVRDNICDEPDYEGIGVVLLAAGEGKRFGFNKLMAELESEPLYRKTVDTIAAACEEANRELLMDTHFFIKPIIVTGQDEIAEYARGMGFAAVINDRPGEGISRSIRLGLQTVMDHYNTSACIFTVCDQPMLTKTTFIRLAKKFEGSEKGMIFTGAMGENGEIISGNPCIFDCKYYGELMELCGDVGGKRVMKAHPEDCEVLTIGDAGELKDIDYPDDLIKLQ